LAGAGVELARCERLTPAHIPLSTYRLQFNEQFTFNAAASIVDYLGQLGISDCYASSYLAAVPGSGHGYDVADPTRLNPEIGSSDDYWRWVDSLRARGMGHILDVVPNHMGIAKSANPWWSDVLENGPSSRYARFFDIEWRPVKDELFDKVLLPILGDQYGEVLERQELTLAFERGAFVVRHYDDRLPIAPETMRMIFGSALDRWIEDHRGDDADELLSILSAAEHLPSRSSRDAESIAVRAREKEIVKRRLTALEDRSDQVRTLIANSIDLLNGKVGQPRTFDALDALLNAQSYRLAHWRVASEEINYRRFFDVNQLAALRMEDPEVFDEVHRFVFELVGKGAPTGLRIDHVDGLYSPADYLERLQSRIASTAEAPNGAPFFVVVEKILGADEGLPAEWPVAGTTGYEFSATVNNLFVDRRNAAALDQIYRRFVRDRLPFPTLVYRSKKQVLHETMSGDINSLGHQLNRFSERNRHFRDFTLYSLISSLKEVIACFPVYRTYVTATGPVSAHDRRYVREAIADAKRRAPGPASMVFDFIERILLKQTTTRTTEECEDRARFIGKFQQITSPVAAKGIEDTVLYVDNRLLSLNEVGSEPTRFGIDPPDVHRWMIERRRCWPHALSATSTHDSKRGEDVRARLNVLSEIPGAWKEAVSKWRAVNRRFKLELPGGALAPDPNEEYFLYQTLIGAWPFGDFDLAAFRERIRRYMLKAMRESKVHTTWLSPNEEHEGTVLEFVDAILDRRRGALFFQAFAPFQARVAQLGIYNSLSQLLIKVAAPGIPDFYQGSELWDLNLVDPDNRRPVDYQTRSRLLAELGPDADPGGLLAERADGRVKLFVAHRSLKARAASRATFERGDYLPLEASGGRAESLFAFGRRFERSIAVVCVPRLVASLIPDAARPPLGRDVWGDTRVAVPTGRYRNVFTGKVVCAEGAGATRDVEAATLFADFPVALLVTATS
jgi:(1->4)-alpha-D-glucan 1-alpha-D-glucosylmutase